MFIRNCVAFVLLVTGIQAQSRPAFEIASVKLNKECRGGQQSRMPTPGRLHLECMTLRDLIQVAYVTLASGVGVNRDRADISELPGWAESDRFTIDAKADGPAPVGQMGGPMLQALLEDRFKLNIHREKRLTPGYALSVGTKGPKMTPAQAGSCMEVDLDHLPQRKPGEPATTFCGAFKINVTPKVFTLATTGITLTEFAHILSDRFQQPVVDKTGLAGRYDFKIEVARDESAPPLSSYGSDVIMAGIQSQLGLKFSPEKLMADWLVVDSVDKPTEN